MANMPDTLNSTSGKRGGRREGMKVTDRRGGGCVPAGSGRVLGEVVMPLAALCFNLPALAISLRISLIILIIKRRMGSFSVVLLHKTVCCAISQTSFSE